MTRRTLPSEQYARAAAGWNDEFFQIRILDERDPERLRAVIEHEVERNAETRTERIAKVNQQLHRLGE